MEKAASAKATEGTVYMYLVVALAPSLEEEHQSPSDTP